MYEDNEKLISAYQSGQTELLNTIIENNLSLIHLALKSLKWAYNKHPKYDEIITYEDFYQEGYFGLRNAIDKYDPEQGAFSTYAIIHIRQSVFRFFYNNSRVIRVPYEPRKAYKSVRASETQYIKEYGHEPSTKELSVYSGVPFEEIQELRRIFSETISVDASIGQSEGDSATIGDIIPDKTDCLSDVEREMTVKALRKDLERMAEDVLKDDDRVKMLFYYFDNAEKKQINEIAKECKVSRSSLSRIINESLGKIYNKYLDELIEGYSDLFSTGIRRSREQELRKTQVRNAVKTFASKMLHEGDSLTVLDGFSENGLKESIQVTVRRVDDIGIMVSYVRYDSLKLVYKEQIRTIWFSSIIDFRTQDKRIVEIGCVRGLM